jgi:hypothetical protein
VKLLSRAGANDSTASDIEKLIEVIAYGKNNSAKDAKCADRWAALKALNVKARPSGPGGKGRDE